MGYQPWESALHVRCIFGWKLHCLRRSAAISEFGKRSISIGGAKGDECKIERKVATFEIRPPFCIPPKLCVDRQETASIFFFLHLLLTSCSLPKLDLQTKRPP